VSCSAQYLAASTIPAREKKFELVSSRILSEQRGGSKTLRGLTSRPAWSLQRIRDPSDSTLRLRKKSSISASDLLAATLYAARSKSRIGRHAEACRVC
jgi:hypothetical protein